MKFPESQITIVYIDSRLEKENAEYWRQLNLSRLVKETRDRMSSGTGGTFERKKEQKKAELGCCSSGATYVGGRGSREREQHTHALIRLYRVKAPWPTYT